MITLYVFGRAFGLEDPSPFIAKTHVLLRMAGLEYKTAPADFKKAPKGKFPVIEDDGVLVPDSSLIRIHLEQKYGVDFDRGISAKDCAAGWAFEKLCEDQIYWAIVQERWMKDENFEKGPKNFFNKAPALIRPLIIHVIRRKIRKNLQAHGWGRYTPEEQRQLGGKAIKAIADYLADRPYIGGNEPCGSDAAVFATVESILTPYFSTDLRIEAQKFPVLIEYATRMKARYFPEGA